MKRREFILTTGLVAGLGTVTLAGAAAKQTTIGEDPLGVRKDFPVTQKLAYLNTAYTGAVPIRVAEAGIAFERSKAYDPISLPDMMQRVEQARGKFAALIGALEQEIGFLFATSEGENIITRALELKPGDNIVTDELHYTTTYVLYRQLEKTHGIELRIVPTHDGATRLEDFERLTDARTRLISVSWVSHGNGFRYDVRPLADLAHAHGAYLYVDAVQAVGMFPLDVMAEGIDFLTSGSYKWMHASYNAAGFYVREALLDRITPDRAGYLHVKELEDFHYEHPTSARKYEFAAPAFSGIYQMERAVDYLTHIGLARIEAHIVPLANHLNNELREQGFDVHTPAGNPSGIVTFAHHSDPEAVQKDLDAANIVVTNRRKEKHIRVSVGLHNNRAEVDAFLEVMREFA